MSYSSHELLLALEIGRILGPDDRQVLGVIGLNLLDGQGAEEDILLVQGKCWLIAAGFHKGLNEASDKLSGQVM